MRIYVIFNPTARGHKAGKLSEILQSSIGGCHFQPTFYPGEARLLAATAVAEGFDSIVAAGGDGTVNEVLNGISDVPDGFLKTRMGVLPLGTINVFARELGISFDLAEAWKTILLGRETIIDVPRVEFIKEGKLISRYFAQLAGAGLDSQAVEMVDWEWKKRIGPLAYVAAGMKALGSQKSKITVSNKSVSMTGELVLIGNGRLYGGTFVLFPKADLRDGQLEVCVFPKVNWMILARATLGLATNSLHRLCGAEEIQADSFTLTADRKTFLQLDGENVGELPATFSIQPKLLRVLVPEKKLTSQFATSSE